MIFTGSAIAAATHGTLLRDGPAGPILTDSRRLTAGSWFVALQGERFDGHSFLPHAAASGCAGAIVSRPVEGWRGGLVIVPDTLLALQDLARSVRAGFHGPVVAITGSAGKTSTRVMVVEVLRALGRIHHTEGNLNNHIGVPLTLLATPPDADAIVLEMGMNHPGEIAVLQEIGQPDVRLITNVGAAHVEGCGSIDGVASAKRELFDGARPGDVCCVNMDDARIAAMERPDGVSVLRYGRGSDNDVRLTDVSIDPASLQTRIRIEAPGGTIRATLDVPGAHLATNAAAAVAVATALHVPADSLSAALARFQPEGMRNRIERIGGALVIDDAYNANPVSMLAALETLAALDGTRVAVLGDMLELGSAEADAHRDVLAAALRLGIDRVMVVGPRISAAAGEGIEVYADVEAIVAALAPSPGLAVLVKGSRGSKMERVVDGLRAQRRRGEG